MTRDLMLEMIRDDEQLALTCLHAPASTGLAYTDVPVARDVYAVIETPPNPALAFQVRTFWTPEPWTAVYHLIGVQERGALVWLTAQRPGLFGGAR